MLYLKSLVPALKPIRYDWNSVVYGHSRHSNRRKPLVFDWVCPPPSMSQARSDSLLLVSALSMGPLRETEAQGEVTCPQVSKPRLKSSFQLSQGWNFKTINLEFFWWTRWGSLSTTPPPTKEDEVICTRRAQLFPVGEDELVWPDTFVWLIMFCPTFLLIKIFLYLFSRGCSVVAG